MTDDRSLNEPAHRAGTPTRDGSPAARGGLLICGATSDAGKSTVATALCRALHRRGFDVAPFKAQNMSNHAAVTSDGGEVAIAQEMQARAARVPLDRRMNPVLLKPTSDTRSHVVVMGDERATTGAADYGERTQALKPVALEALTSLREQYAFVVAEGAGGAAEINLLGRDLVNLPLAHAAGLPAVLVVDIERGGAFAAAHGTIDLLPAHLRATVTGIVFNRFRGDPRLLDPGIRELERRTGVPLLGVLPHLGTGPMPGGEDSLDIRPGDVSAATRSARPVRVAVVRLPHLANPADLDPLIAEPDVQGRWVTSPAELADADLVVLPGSRATVADLAWLRDVGLADAIVTTEATVVGLCAGHQMLGTTIHDDVESGAGTVAGLAVHRTVTTFRTPKLVRRSHGRTYVHATTRLGTDRGDAEVAGFQLRLGRPQSDEAPWLRLDGDAEGAIGPTGRTFGTSLHGLFDADEFRTRFLATVAERRDRSYLPAPEPFDAVIETHLERLADWLEEHTDVDAMLASASTALPLIRAPGW